MGVAARLAFAMLALQFAIGTANDMVDVSADRIGHPLKPIPSGRLTADFARVVFAVCAVAGLTLAASVRFEALVVGAIGLSDGLFYDLRLKGTPWSWVPFAAGVALLPVFSWLGAVGTLPRAFLGILPMALLAGAMLATTNALADQEGDRAAGARSIATELGRNSTLMANAALLAAIQAIAVGTTIATGGQLAGILAEAAGIVLGWAGLGLAASSQNRLVRLAWEIQAIGVVALGAGWLASLSSAGFLGTT